MKYQLKLNQVFPFAQNPTMCELEAQHIICNDVMLPAEIDADSRFNPHNVRLWVIGHEFGAICAIFASCEQDALDAAVDADELDSLLSEDQNYEDETLTSLGNASELFDLSHAWISTVDFEPVRDILLITKLARAAADGADNLDF